MNQLMEAAAPPLSFWGAFFRSPDEAVQDTGSPLPPQGSLRDRCATASGRP